MFEKSQKILDTAYAKFELSLQKELASEIKKVCKGSIKNRIVVFSDNQYSANIYIYSRDGKKEHSVNDIGYCLYLPVIHKLLKILDGYNKHADKVTVERVTVYI